MTPSLHPLPPAIGVAIDALIGKPYALGGRGPYAYDCWGLVLELRQRLGLPMPPDWRIETPDVAAQRRLMGNELLQDQADWTRLAEPATGVIAYSERQAHAGVVVFGRIVHAAMRYGVVSWPLAQWQRAFPDARFYEWPIASSS
jgi:cell wall-associated NlpC family hydrolase